MFCEDCEKKLSCKKVCKEVNKYLQANKIYSSDYIRPRISSDKRGEKGALREIPVEDIDKVATQRAFQLKGGKGSHK